MLVTRPVVRQFKPRFVAEISAHVRAGGHAVVWDSESRARLVFPPPKKGEDMDLALWSLLDLGKSSWTTVERGLLRGLGTSPVPRDCLEIVRHRAERDSIHEGSLRTMELDCLECGACCRDNEVILEKRDIDRFEKGGRAELAKPPFARKQDGKMVLKLLPNKKCQHLAGDNKCGIYAIRPDSCSEFPMASEPCLFSREEELKLIDGASGTAR